MSPFRQHRPLGPGRLAVLLTLGPLAGCARAPIDLDLSPSRGPTLRTAIGPLTVSGTLGREGLGVGLRSGPPVTDAGRESKIATSAVGEGVQVLSTCCSGMVPSGVHVWKACGWWPHLSSFARGGTGGGRLWGRFWRQSPSSNDGNSGADAQFPHEIRQVDGLCRLVCLPVNQEVGGSNPPAPVV